MENIYCLIMFQSFAIRKNILTRIELGTDKPTHTTHIWPHWNSLEQVPKAQRCPGAEPVCRIYEIWTIFSNLAAFIAACFLRVVVIARLLIIFIGPSAAYLMLATLGAAYMGQDIGILAYDIGVCGYSNCHLMIVTQYTQPQYHRPCPRSWYHILTHNANRHLIKLLSPLFFIF